jgi:hypothetical protein
MAKGSAQLMQKSWWLACSEPDDTDPAQRATATQQATQPLRLCVSAICSFKLTGPGDYEITQPPCTAPLTLPAGGVLRFRGSSFSPCPTRLPLWGPPAPALQAAVGIYSRAESRTFQSVGAVSWLSSASSNGARFAVAQRARTGDARSHSARGKEWARGIRRRSPHLRSLQ